MFIDSIKSSPLWEKTRILRRNYNRNNDLKKLSFGDNENDFFLISYPKSGNTWLRVMLAYALEADGEREIAFHNIHEYIPDSHIPQQLNEVVHNSEAAFNSFPVRIIKSHDSYRPYYKRKKVVYILREGKAVINSFYHYINARRPKKVETDVFVKGNTYEVGSWSNHLLGWKNADANVLFVKFEDLKDDPKKEVTRILDYLGLELTEEKIEEIVAKASFNRMKEFEQKYGYYSDKRTEEGKKVSFVRKGQKKETSSIFSEEEFKLFEHFNREAYQAFNYPFTHWNA